MLCIRSLATVLIAFIVVTFTVIGTTTAQRRDDDLSYNIPPAKADAVARADSKSPVPGKHANLCDLKFALEHDPEHPEKDKFVGSFDGWWGGNKLSHTVIVYRVEDDGEVLTYYAHGKYRPWSIPEPKCFPVMGKVSGNDTIVLRPFRNGALVQYTLHGDTLKGTYRIGSTTVKGTFTRVK